MSYCIKEYKCTKIYRKMKLLYFVAVIFNTINAS